MKPVNCAESNIFFVDKPQKLQKTNYENWLLLFIFFNIILSCIIFYLFECSLNTNFINCFTSNDNPYILVILNFCVLLYNGVLIVSIILFKSFLNKAYLKKIRVTTPLNVINKNNYSYFIKTIIEYALNVK